jgi:hypothetical protein
VQRCTGRRNAAGWSLIARPFVVEPQVVEWLVRYGFFAQIFGIFGLPIPDELPLTIAAC